MKKNSNNPKQTNKSSNAVLEQWEKEMQIERHLEKKPAKPFEQVQFRNKRFNRRFAFQASVYKRFNYCNKYYTNNKVSHKDQLQAYLSNHIQ